MMRRAPLLALLLAAGCAASAPTVEAPVVSIPPAAPSPDRPAPVSAASDPGRDARMIAALNSNGDIDAALGPQRPDPQAPPYSLRGGAGLNLGSGMPQIGGYAGLPSPTVKGPTAQAAIGATALAGGRVANADKVILGMAAGFRRCFNKGLAANPLMSGTVILTLRVAMTGDVIAASAGSVTGLSPEVVACVTARAQAAQFEPPQGASSATLSIPITFTSTP